MKYVRTRVIVFDEPNVNGNIIPLSEKVNVVRTLVGKPVLFNEEKVGIVLDAIVSNENGGNELQCVLSIEKEILDLDKRDISPVWWCAEFFCTKCQKTATGPHDICNDLEAPKINKVIEMKSIYIGPADSTYEK